MCNEEGEGVTFSGYKSVTSKNRPKPTSMKYVVLCFKNGGKCFSFVAVLEPCGGKR
jgi:hypothetical protein